MSDKWKFAPAWANYCAQDYCGDWWWHENKPSYVNFRWLSVGKQIRFDIAATTLEEKPK